MAKIANVRHGAAVTEAAPKGTEPEQGPGDIIYVTDSQKRRFGLRKLRPSERYSLSKAAGGDTNISCWLQALAVGTVISIDAEGLPAIKSESELMERLDDIGDEGLAAVTPQVLTLYGLTEQAQKDIVDAAKN